MIKLLHQKLKENLIEFDNFCKTNNIEYFLGYGSLIGALRHQGFIPWDDDIDVCMTRDNYQKLISVSKLVPKPFCLKSAFNDGNDNFFMKWEDTSTTVIEKWSEKAKWARGLFIDIFPIDKIPMKRHKITWKIYSLINILLFVRFKKLNFKNFNVWLKLLIMPGYYSLKLIFHLCPDKWFKKWMTYRFSKWNKLENNYNYGCLVDPLEFPKVIFGKELIESKIIKTNFENYQLPILSNSLSFIINKYGDNVMEIPKNKIYENKHFVFFDAHMSYKEYLNNKILFQKLKKIIKAKSTF